MKLSHIRDVLAVAEHGSLRAAGRHLDIAQPVITRSLRELEQELGARLFERHAKGVRLTRIGEAFVRRATIMQGELRRAREEVEQLKGHDVGQVAVALSTGSIISLLPNVFQAFRKRLPNARLRLSESFFKPIEADLLSGTLDVYVGPFDRAASAPQFVSEPLFDNSGVVFARLGHPLASARALRELQDAAWVRPALSGRSGEADFDLLFEQQGLARPNVVLDARSALITLLTVANSDLLTILPRQWRDFPMAASLIQALDLEDSLLKAPICLVRRQDAPLTPLADALCGMVRRAAASYVARRIETSLPEPAATPPSS